MQAAVDIFPIRYVCAFGSDLPDGIIPLDSVYAETGTEAPPHERAHASDRATHLALITWEATSNDVVPVARNHAEVVAGGLAVLLEGRFDTGTTFLSAVPPSSFAGIAVSVIPWLLAGGTLMLHHPFEPDALARQLRDGCDAAALPAPVIPRLLDAGLLGSGLRTVLGLWRAPERMSNARTWTMSTTSFVDVACFGEAGVIATRRGPSGKAAALPLGIVTSPRGAPGAILVAELNPTRDGKLAFSGAMVPRQAYPPGAEEAGLSCFKTADGVVDTGYPCRADYDTRTLVVTGPPTGIADVGGYRFALRELQRLITDIDSGGRITALPDAISGHRLAGAARDNSALRTALLELGVNPLVADAFS
jgi:hypothetical protein